ncbi:MAG: type I restriction endonuclease subunit M, partial [Methanomicrobiales archaeon]|nr:type I restriction endonuclease subunit M [Methanomicrobiales archaeon]
PRYSRMVPVAEIASSANDYNLNIPRYIDSSEPEDIHDLGAHLHGGIPGRDVDALQPYWSVFPTLRDALFRPDGRPGYLEPGTAPGDVRATVLAHPDYVAYSDRVAGVFEGWRAAHEERLKGLGPGASPRELIRTLSEDLLARFAGVPLLDKYDIYQCLMDHWAGMMQDDVDLIIAEGWVAGAKPRVVIEDTARRIRETPDLVIKRRKYRMDLIPPALIVSRYFAADRAAVDEFVGLQEGASRDLEEFIEEHAGEEGLLEDAVSEAGRVTRKAVNDRLKVVGRDPEFIEEREALREALALIDAEARAKRAVRGAQAGLDERVFTRYATLTEDEIKRLVVEDKWFASIRAAIEGEVQRLTQRLAGRVKELDERYARPLPELEREVEELGAKVEEHLRRMGVEW